MNGVDSDTNYFSDFHNTCREQTLHQFELFCKASKFDNSYLKIISVNVRKFFANFDEFVDALQASCYKKPDSWVCCETRLKDSDKEYATLNGYRSMHILRYTDSCGGISLLFKTFLDVELLSDLSFCNLAIEVCTLRVSVKSSAYYVVGIYRPHSGTVDDFIQELACVLDKIPH